MSTPHNENPYGPNPYADPAQEHVPGQAQYEAPGHGPYAASEQPYAPAQGASPAENAAPAEGASPGLGASPGQGAVPEQEDAAYHSYPQNGGDDMAGSANTEYGYGGTDPGGGGRPNSYLNGAPSGLVEAVRGAFSHILSLRGRASRSSFWWFALVGVIVSAILSIIQDRSTAAGVILNIIVGIPFAVAGITLAVRRLHDSNHTGWWWWLGWIPLVGWIIMLVFYLLRSTPGPNRYNVAR